MTGLPEWNFPAFDEAAQTLRAQGHEVVNPAEFVRASGFNPATRTELSNQELREAMVAEFAGLTRLTPILLSWPDRKYYSGIDARACGGYGLADCTDLLLLPGWESSKGAFAEAAVAFWLGLTVWEYGSTVVWDDSAQVMGRKESCKIADLGALINRRSVLQGSVAAASTPPTKDILQEAQEVLADRGKDYGDFSETLQRIARVWEELVGDDEWESRSFRDTIAARFMVALKIVRERGGYKRDNWVDALNYAVGGCEVGAKESDK